MAIEMKKVSAGKLRAIGYDAATRTLRVQMDDGSLVEYAGVPQDTFRRLTSASSVWSYFRDNVEDEFSGKRVR